MRISWSHIGVVLFLSLCNLFYCAAQDMAGKRIDKGPFSIEWIGQISQDDLKAKDGWVQKIGRWIVGSEPPLLSKPVAVLSNSPDEVWILDQNTRTLLQYANGQ